MNLFHVEKLPSSSFPSAHSMFTGAEYLGVRFEDLRSSLQPEMGSKSGFCSKKEMKLTKCCIISEVKPQVY